MTDNTDENPYGIKDRKLESALQQISISIAFVGIIALTYGTVFFLLAGGHGATAAQIASTRHLAVGVFIFGVVVLVGDIIFTRSFIKRGLSEPLPSASEFKRIAKADPGTIREELDERRK